MDVEDSKFLKWLKEKNINIYMCKDYFNTFFQKLKSGLLFRIRLGP